MSSLACVQVSALGAEAAAANQAVAFTANVTVGNLVVVYVTFAGTATSVTVTDNLSNSYTQVAVSQNGVFKAGIFYSVLTTGGSCTVTVTPASGASGTYIDVIAAEYTGQAASPLDTFATDTGSSATMTAGALTLAGTGELIVACFISATAPIPGVSVKNPLRLLGTLTSNTLYPIIAGETFSDANITPTVFQTASNAFAAVSAAFKPATTGGGGGATPVPQGYAS